MSEASNDNIRAAADAAFVFPVVGWEALVGEDPIALMRVGYVRNSGESEAYRAGKTDPAIAPLGFTADQCRKFAADLLAAADAIESGNAEACDPGFIRKGMKAREALQRIEDALVESRLERFDAKTEQGCWTWETTESYLRRLAETSEAT